LHLEIEAPRKPRAEARREGFGAGVVAGQERAADRPAVGARQRDQPVAAFAQPRPLDRRVAACRVLQPAARQQLAQIQIAGAALHQQHQPARPLLRRFGGHADLGAEDRLDAGASRRAVELDRAEEIADIGDGERALAVGGGRSHCVVDPERPIDDRILGMRAQVNEGHRPILGSAAAHFRHADHVTSGARHEACRDPARTVVGNFGYPAQPPRRSACARRGEP
jgi:hypothetical protein